MHHLCRRMPQWLDPRLSLIKGVAGAMDIQMVGRLQWIAGPKNHANGAHKLKGADHTALFLAFLL